MLAPAAARACSTAGATWLRILETFSTSWTVPSGGGGGPIPRVKLKQLAKASRKPGWADRFSIMVSLSKAGSLSKPAMSRWRTEARPPPLPYRGDEDGEMYHSIKEKSILCISLLMPPITWGFSMHFSNIFAKAAGSIPNRAVPSDKNEAPSGLLSQASMRLTWTCMRVHTYTDSN